MAATRTKKSKSRAGRRKVYKVCRRCGRSLNDEASKLLGFGKDCRSRQTRAARVLEESGHPVALKAAAILRNGDFKNTTKKNVWHIPSQSGAHPGLTYRTTPEDCTCEAGLNNVLCCHRIAAIILAV